MPQTTRSCPSSFHGTLAVKPELSREEAIMHKEGDHVVETAVEARAGFLDRPVLAVLVVGSLLAAVFLALTFAGVVKF